MENERISQKKAVQLYQNNIKDVKWNILIYIHRNIDWHIKSIFDKNCLFVIE